MFWKYIFAALRISNQIPGTKLNHWYTWIIRRDAQFYLTLMEVTLLPFNKSSLSKILTDLGRLFIWLLCWHLLFHESVSKHQFAPINFFKFENLAFSLILWQYWWCKITLKYPSKYLAPHHGPDTRFSCLYCNNSLLQQPAQWYGTQWLCSVARIKCCHTGWQEMQVNNFQKLRH